MAILLRLTTFSKKIVKEVGKRVSDWKTKPNTYVLNTLINKKDLILNIGWKREIPIGIGTTRDWA
jgi:hypothetical protein